MRIFRRDDHILIELTEYEASEAAIRRDDYALEVGLYIPVTDPGGAAGDLYRAIHETSGDTE